MFLLQFEANSKGSWREKAQMNASSPKFFLVNRHQKYETYAAATCKNQIPMLLQMHGFA